MAQAKNWCFTLNNPDYDELELADKLVDAVYAVFQLEIGENGTPHYQGYCMFSERLRLSQVRVYLATAHWETAKGTPKQNREYCTKPETRVGEFCEIGIFPETGQGKRNDLAELHSALKNGLRHADYVEQYFDLWVKYPNLLTYYQSASILPRSAQEETHAWLYIGPPGTGKSRLAYRHAESLFGDMVFRKFPGKWWDGYRGEKAVIWDDFRGHYCSFTDFKLCVDRYPLRVEVKGTTCNLAANHFFITTNYDPSDWWTEEVTGSDRSAIFRRITRVLWVPLPGQFRSFPSYEAYRQEVLIPRPSDTEIPVLTQINWDAPQI